MEGRRAPNLFALRGLALMQNFILKVWGPSKCLIGSPMKICNSEHRRVARESHVVFQLWLSLVVSSRAFFGNLSCVFGEPVVVRPCSTLGFFWTSSRDDFWCFLVSGPDFRGSGAPAMLLFRTVHRQVHTFVPVGATRRPTRQQMGSPSRFFPPLWGRFSEHFLIVFRLFRNLAIL